MWPHGHNLNKDGRVPLIWSYMQNIEDLCLVVSNKNKCSCFLYITISCYPPGRGQFRSRGPLVNKLGRGQFSDTTS